ncbi:MAG: PAS domain S-box protein [Flavitalea sp.]
MLLNCSTLLESISDGIIILDKDESIIYINKAATEISGYSLKDVEGKPLYSAFSNDPANIIQMEYGLSECIKNGSFVSSNWRYRLNGSKYWSNLTLTRMIDGTGTVCLFKDLTEEKSLELQLRMSEEKYRLMIDSVKDYAIFLIDATGHIVTWNEGAKHTKGYLQEEIVGKHFSIFYTAEDLKNEKPARELVIAAKTGKYEEEGWRVKKNGSVFWANIVLTALFNDKNSLIGYSKVTRDLTERKLNEEFLRQSEERYRLLVEQVIDYGIFMMDNKGRIVSWNEGAKNISGYNIEEILGKYFSIFYPEEDIISNKPSRELRIAKQTGKYEEEGWRLKKDGSKFWASIVITAVYNHDKTLIGYSKVTRDLSERKASETALKESYDQYKKLTAELRKINDELSYTNRELEQFTSIVSHDLQEPVRTIKSFLQLINIRLENHEYDDLIIFVNKAINASNRMRELIQNLLNYSQLTKEEIIEKSIGVRELIGLSLQNLKAAIDAANAEINIETEVETIQGDPVQLVQLIQNLISNALKFTDNSSPQILIRCSMENDHVKFSVSDNGIGIDRSDSEKIFEIFRRLHTKKEYPGTGIGLAICKKIVDMHKGRIWPESEPGKGTTFHFTLHEEMKEEII